MRFLGCVVSWFCFVDFRLFVLVCMMALVLVLNLGFADIHLEWFCGLVIFGCVAL